MRSPTVFLLALAGTAWMLGQAVLPDMGTTAEERYANVAAAPGMQALSAALLFVAAALLVLGGLSAARHTPEGPGRRLVAVGARMTALGGIWLAAGRAAFNLELLTLTGSTVPEETALQLMDAGDSAAFVALVLTLPCLLLGPLLMAVGVARAGLTGWLPTALWVVGLGVFLGTEFQVKAAEIAGIATAAGALALIGHALERTEVSAAARTGSCRAVSS